MRRRSAGRGQTTLFSQTKGREVNAVIYCRVSTKEQVNNLSLSTQESRCIDYCTQNDWAVVSIFRDEGESAKTVDRPQFQRMLSFCKRKQNEVSFVVVHDLSRFSRLMEDQVTVLTELERAGVRLRSVLENVDETPAGKLVRNICGAVNQFDNDRKAERTRLGMQRAANMGRFPFKAALGYLNLSNRTGPNLIADPDRAPLVQKAFELYASGTETRAGVLRTITNLGLTTGSGRKVTVQTFERMLRNPIYAGWVVIPSWDLRARGSFAPLVTEALFSRVQDILEGKRVTVTSHARNNPDFPLRVFVLCGECKTPITGSWSKGRKDRYAYYRCRNSKCRAVNVRRESLERQFTDLLRRLAPERAYMKLFKEIVMQVWKHRQADSALALSKTVAALEELRQRKHRVVDFYLDGRLDKQTYDEQALRLGAEIQEAERRLRDADEDSVDIVAVVDFAENLVERPSELWLESSIEQKQRLQSVFFPEGVTFTSEGFGTAPSHSFFNDLSCIADGKLSLASPTGFEPVLSP